MAKKDYNWVWWPENYGEAVEMVKNLKAQIACISRDLPYADHGAYGQDKRTIADNWSQIRRIQRMIDEDTYA